MQACPPSQASRPSSGRPNRQLSSTLLPRPDFNCCFSGANARPASASVAYQHPSDAAPYLSCSSYDSLHDPHLREYLSKPAVRRQLVDMSFVTLTGKIVPDVLEKNKVAEDALALVTLEHQETTEQLSRALAARNVRTRKNEQESRGRRMWLLRYVEERRHREQYLRRVGSFTPRQRSPSGPPPRR